ncbi:hypothetical protein AB2M62_18520 [Sphingomonas sp. MMS12-HWE2-04]|uniref:head-tail connector protein n=1 Tax=Sphingomonas sp. MMS12-HWE2-04 TaxID=3234199 RepID=UPI00384D2E2E
MTTAFPPAAIAAARDAAKAHLRIAGDGEDALIARHAAAALELCEAFTGRATLIRDRSDMVAGSGWQRLAGAPVVAITGVVRIADDGSAVPLANDGYAIDIDAAGEGRVRIARPGGDRFAVDYSAGVAASWEALPPALAQGVVVLIAHLFEARSVSAPPAAVSALWRPWRRMTLGVEARA